MKKVESVSISNAIVRTNADIGRIPTPTILDSFFSSIFSFSFLVAVL